MPHYYFDIQDGARFIRDTVGYDCDSLEAVRKEAITALPGMARDALPEEDPYEISVTARDADGQAVFRATLALKTEWLGRSSKSDDQTSRLY